MVYFRHHMNTLPNERKYHFLRAWQKSLTAFIKIQFWTIFINKWYVFMVNNLSLTRLSMNLYMMGDVGKPFGTI